MYKVGKTLLASYSWSDAWEQAVDNMKEHLKEEGITDEQELQKELDKKIADGEVDEVCNEIDNDLFFDLRNTLGELILERFNTHIFITAKNMGWAMRSGYKEIDFDRDDFQEDIGKYVLEQLAPRGDCTVKVYSLSSKRGLYLNITHHDNPVNGDQFYLTRAKPRKA